MNRYYTGEVGTAIIVDVETDISSATVTRMSVKKPSGALATWEATIEGKTAMRHVTVDGDWDEVGTYHLQAYVEMPGWKGFGNTVQFTISNRFD